MRVLVDSSVWSLALRRRARNLTAEQAALRSELTDLIADARILMIGPVRQDLLSGIREQSVFERLRVYLRSFPDEPLTEDDYEEAAQATNRCLAAGLGGSAVDMLICAVAIRRGAPLFTVDLDFSRYATRLPIRLYVSAHPGRPDTDM